MLAAGCGSQKSGPAGVACVRAPITGGTPQAEYLALHESQALAIAALRILDGSGELLGLCTGTLVAPDLLLTAAHCIVEEAEEYVVAFGNAALAATVEVPVIQTILHPTLDAALLHLAPAQADAVGARIIAVDREGRAQEGALVQIAGFGLTETRSVGTKLYAVSRIREVQDDLFRIDAEGRAAACDGDSGGPALIRDVTGAVAIAGILTSGAATCSAVDTYVRLAQLASWLEANGVGQSEQLPIADCSLIGAQGRCFEGAAIWCEAETARTQACGVGETCGYSEVDAGFRCIETAQDTCDGVTDRGACVGDDRLRCLDGRLVTDPCGECDATCQFSVRTGQAICNAVSAR